MVTATKMKSWCEFNRSSNLELEVEVTKVEHLDHLLARHSWLEKRGNGREIQKVGRWGFAYTFATTHTESVLALPVKNTDKFKFFGSNVMYIHIRLNNIFVKQGIGKL